MLFSAIAYLLPFTRYPYRGETVPCNLCGSTGTALICGYDRRFKRLRTVACTGCGLMRTDPMPTPAEVAGYYRNVYRWDYQFVTGTPSRRHLSRSRKEAARRLDELAPALRPGSRILDFGCGAGVFLGIASREGFPVRGIEPGNDYAAYARKTFGVDVIGDLWENIELPASSFDVITTVEVLEHLREPVAALGWLASLLADDGVIYVTVPDISPTDREAFRLFHFAHLHHFTPETLLRAGAVCGLEPDPRFTPRKTAVTFRKTRTTADPAGFQRSDGVGLRARYPNQSVARYLLSGAWLFGRFRQLRKTLRDTFSRN